MNYKTKNMIQAVATCFGLTVGFYFFFGMKWILVSLAIGLFLSISMFFNPNKIEKLKRQEQASKSSIDPKDITIENIDELNLDDINLDEEE